MTSTPTFAGPPSQKHPGMPSALTARSSGGTGKPARSHRPVKSFVRSFEPRLSLGVGGRFVLSRQLACSLVSLAHPLPNETVRGMEYQNQSQKKLQGVSLAPF